MRVVEPHTTAAEELEHRLRNVSPKRQAELKAIAQDASAGLSGLDDFERGLVEFMRDKNVF